MGQRKYQKTMDRDILAHDCHPASTINTSAAADQQKRLTADAPNLDLLGFRAGLQRDEYSNSIPRHLAQRLLDDSFRKYLRTATNLDESNEAYVDKHIAECESHLPKTAVASQPLNVH